MTNNPNNVRVLTPDEYATSKASYLKHARDISIGKEPVSTLSTAYTPEQYRELLARDLAEIEAGGTKFKVTEDEPVSTSSTARTPPAGDPKPVDARAMTETVYQQYKREYLTQNRGR